MKLSKIRDLFERTWRRLDAVADAVEAVTKTVNRVDRLAEELLDAIELVNKNRNLCSVLAIVRGDEGPTRHRAGVGYVSGEGRELAMNLGPLRKGVIEFEIVAVGGLITRVLIGDREVFAGGRYSNVNAPAPFVIIDASRHSELEGLPLQVVAVAP